MTRARVLKTAIKVADREGLQALTMRRLGTQLGVEAMSLYHHLPGKDSLLDGLAEALFEEITAAVAERPATLTGDWKSDLRSRCLAARSVVLRHPWTPALFASRQSVPPALYVYVDSIVALLAEAGFSHRIVHRALHALGSLMFGFAQELFSPPTSGGKLDAQKAQAEFARIAGKVPNIVAMAAAEMHHANDPSIGWCDSQAEFEFTLDLLLDGLARLRTADPAGASGN
ncbi:MAG TPA: TetR/AcrR family transcriptional regulator C-terminal domain-containing protein [Steroidobacteraceae bacterium]|nr:TetR/AcrR family transcriptional regulator C-terminal domain-containing protein [Steroidobacteraceae bacterium]